MTIAFQGAFTGGVMDPALSARVDLSRYSLSCDTLTNFVVQAQGGAYRRPGLEFIVRALGDTSSDVNRLIPFQYNVEQAYILVFSDQKMRVIMDGGVVLSTDTAVVSTISAITQASPAQVTTSDTHGLSTGDEVFLSGSTSMSEINGRFFVVTVVDANNFTLDGIDSTSYDNAGTDGTVQLLYSVAHPYLASELNDLYVAQSADTMYICHPSHQPYTLTRTGHDAWTFAAVSIGTTANTPDTSGSSATWAGATGAGYVYRYKITAVDVNGQESLASNAIETDGTTEKEPGAWGTDNSIDVGVPVTTGAAQYNVYKEHYGNGVYGYVGSTVTTGAGGFRDDNYTPDELHTPPTDYDPFSSGADYYPSVVSFFKQRLWYGGSNKLPQTLWASQVNLFNNFNKALPLLDSDSMQFTLASTQVNALKWLIPFSDLLLGTSGAEWKISSASGGSFTPTTTNADVQSYWGSENVAPIIIGDSVVHVQAKSGKIRDLFFSFEKDSYSGDDLTVMANHLFVGKTVVSWAYQRSPDSILWCVMSDGSLYGLTYHKEHKVWGWHKHESSDAFFESVAVIPGTTYDDVYVVARRDSGYYRTVEKITDKWALSSGVSAAVFVDSCLSYSGAAKQVFYGLDHLAGETVVALADGSPIVNLTVSSDGVVDLGTTATAVHIGLNYTSTLAPMGVEALGSEAQTVGRVKSLAKIIIRFAATVGGKIGPTTDYMDSLKFTPATYGAAIVPEETLDYEFTPPASYSRNGRFYVQQDQPLPMTVLALIPDFISGGL